MFPGYWEELLSGGSREGVDQHKKQSLLENVPRQSLRNETKSIAVSAF
jgi:hypothetical protein